MLAGLLSCFKGRDGTELSPEALCTNGRRNPVHNGSNSQAEQPGQKPLQPAATVTGSSATPSTLQAEDQTHKSHDVPSIVGYVTGHELRCSCCSHRGVSHPQAMCALPGGVGRGAGDNPPRNPTPPMLLSLRHLHLALVPVDYCSQQQQQQHSPFTTDSPSGDLRPASVDMMGMPFGDLPTSDSSDPASVSGLHPQLRFVNACRLGEEVQDLQLLARGGYGMVMTGNWKQEGRVAVKVLLSDEDKWVESCYKEAVISKMLAHPNILQTYDYQVAVLTHADVARARSCWEPCQLLSPRSGAVSLDQDGDAPGGSTPRLSHPDVRADSFELLPPLCSNTPDIAAAGGAAAGGDRGGCGWAAAAGAVDLWQVLHILRARAGQYVTLIIMEYAEVGTLQRAIAAGSFRESARLSRWAALRSLLVTAREIAGAMCLLHSYKIIHGDLSATNVMLRASRIDKRGFVAKVADFGLSKVTLSGVARTVDWAGQAQYLAPECLDYESRLASDVFAFGVLLYELATGGRAFGEYAPAQILAGRLAGDLVLRWPSDVAADLRNLAERCMLQDPEARPSFREVVEDLRRQDAEAKAQHRQHSMRRRCTADWLSTTATGTATAATVVAAAAAVTPGACGGGSGGRMPSLLGPHRFTAATTALQQRQHQYQHHQQYQLQQQQQQNPQHHLQQQQQQRQPVPATTMTGTDRFGSVLVSASAAAVAARAGASSAAASATWTPKPRGLYEYGNAAGGAGRRSTLRHSFTTGSTGLAGAPDGGSSGGGGGGSAAAAVIGRGAGLGRAATTTSVVTPASMSGLMAMATVVPDIGSDTFTAVVLNTESSRTLGMSPFEDGNSGRLCTATMVSYSCAMLPSGNPSVEKSVAQQLAPIPSGEV